MRKRAYLPLLLASCFILMAASPNTTGSSDVTPLQQLFVFKELKPDIQRIGIIWNEDSANRGALMPKIQQASASTGIEVFVANVKELKEIAPQYRTLVRNNDIQALWIVENDGVVDSAIGQKFLLKETTQKGIPILAPTEEWVNNGATVSLKRAEGQIQLVVNQAAASALALAIPEKYQERTQYAMN